MTQWHKITCATVGNIMRLRSEIVAVSQSRIVSQVAGLVGAGTISESDVARVTSGPPAHALNAVDHGVGHRLPVGVNKFGEDAVESGRLIAQCPVLELGVTH